MSVRRFKRKARRAERDRQRTGGPMLGDTQLSRTQGVWLDRLALALRTGNVGWETRARRHLAGEGDVGDPIDQAVIDAYLEEHGDTAAENALGQYANKGPRAARSAARMESMLGEWYVDRAGETASLTGAEDIARSSGALEELFAGYGLDMTSPAVQAAIGEFAGRRTGSLTDYRNRLGERISSNKAAARAGSLSPEALIDMGDTQFAMERLREEERMLRGARMGRMAGSAFGAGAGFLLGGPGGAGAGYQMGGQMGYDLGSLLYS